MFNKLKQFKDIRDQAKHMQSMLAEVIVVGKGAKDRVMITIDGNQKVQGVKIEDGMSTEEIQSGVQEAFNDATKQMQKELAMKMRDMGGMQDMMKNLGM